MKVFIVGAGFSESAGYPLGSELIDKFEGLFRGTAWENYRSDWRQFAEWRDKQEDLGIKEIIRTGNVEYIVTYLDILLGAFEEVMASFPKKFPSLGPEEKAAALREHEAHLTHAKEARTGAQKARYRIRKLLVGYFEHMNRLDQQEEHKERQKCILEFCREKVNLHDKIISFNYDALIERALYKQGKWNPSNGYGFEKEFKEDDWKDPQMVPFEASDVKVLKLHGSVGWYLNRQTGRIFFESADFLRNFKMGIKDVEEPAYLPKRDSPQVIEPSFVKSITVSDLLKVWQDAASALREAGEVYVIGYSMPLADGAAQSLIVNNIRVNDKLREINVVDPTQGTLNRYKEFFGEKVVPIKRTLEDWLAVDCETREALGV